MTAFNRAWIVVRSDDAQNCEMEDCDDPDKIWFGEDLMPLASDADPDHPTYEGPLMCPNCVKKMWKFWEDKA